MATNIISHSWRVPDGETLAFDLRNAGFEMSVIIRIPDGVTASRKFSSANIPGNKFVTPEVDASVTASGASDSISAMEQTPFAWLSVSASGGDAFVDICAYDASSIPVHDSSADVPTSKSAPSVSVAVGESVSLPWIDFFNYEKGDLDLNGVSANTANVTVSVDLNDASVTFTGVAASTATNVTLTATSPAEETVALTVPVEITA